MLKTTGLARIVVLAFVLGFTIFLFGGATPVSMGSNQDKRSAPIDPNTTIYFGYGSNLWIHQMGLRCPQSTYLGIARLPGYQWVINNRGYANVVELPQSKPQSSPNIQLHDWSSEVWGMVYSLSASDEERLDINEGVPIAYTKEILPVQFWPTANPSPSGATILSHPNHNTMPQQQEMLIYIDRKRIEPSSPKKEYVHRMNKGIDDALEAGVPKEYVENVMRKFIPEEDLDVDMGGAQKQLAMKQAMNFAEEGDLEGKFGDRAEERPEEIEVAV